MQNKRMNYAPIWFSCLFAMATLTACDNIAHGAKAEATEAQAAVAATGAPYAVDVKASKIEWEGTKPTGKHSGTLALQEATILVAGSSFSGALNIDMKSLVSTDLTEKTGKIDLETHLKSDDFFDVAKFPTAAFEITKVAELKEAGKTENCVVTGNLSLKGVSKSITFVAQQTDANGVLTVDAPSFVINRLDWGIKTGSKSLAATAKDKIIGDDIGIRLHIVAQKK